MLQILFIVLKSYPYKQILLVFQSDCLLDILAWFKNNNFFSAKVSVLRL